MQKAFTLAETLITLTIIGVVATMTIPVIVHKSNDARYVSKAKETFSILSEATRLWMIEEGCDYIDECISDMVASGIKSPNGFNGIASKLKIVDSTSYLQKIDKSGIDISQKNLKNISWLPEKTIMYNGQAQRYAYEGVSKVGGGGTNEPVGLYLLANGATLSLQFPDANMQSGFGYFDVNGVKKPNKVGVDVYPIGWGIPYKTEAQRKKNEEIFGVFARTVNPFYVEDNVDAGGLCVVRNGNENHCTSDMKSNPLAYLLLHNKVPNK